MSSKRPAVRGPVAAAGWPADTEGPVDPDPSILISGDSPGRHESECEPRIRNLGRALLIAPSGSYRLSAWMRAAAGLDLDILVAAEGEHSLMPIGLMPIESMPLEADGRLGLAPRASGLRIDFDDPQGAVDRILAEHRKQAIAVVIGTDDITLELAGLTARALGLAHNDPESARISRRKDMARTAMAEAGLPIPSFRRLDLRFDLGSGIDALWDRRPADSLALPFDFPCVVKPLAMSASRGVIRADDLGQLHDACRRTAAIVESAKPSIDEEEAGCLLIESFIPGPEIALEGLLRQGELQTISIFDKPDPLDGPFFEETLYITPSRLPEAIQRTARRRVQEGCAACGLREGPVHAELRIHDRDAWIIEIAARTIGGDCARLFRFGAADKSLETVILQHALRASPDLSMPEGRAAGVSMIPTPAAGVLRRVEGVLEASRIPGIQEVSIAVREGYPLLPLPEGGEYLGFVFAEGDDPEEVEAALRRANDELRVIIAPSIPLDIAG